MPNVSFVSRHRQPNFILKHRFARALACSSATNRTACPNNTTARFGSNLRNTDGGGQGSQFNLSNAVAIVLYDVRLGRLQGW